MRNFLSQTAPERSQSPAHCSAGDRCVHQRRGTIHPATHSLAYLTFRALTHSHSSLCRGPAPSSSLLTSPLFMSFSWIKIHSPAKALELVLIRCSGREALAKHQFSSLSQKMSFPVLEHSMMDVFTTINKHNTRCNTNSFTVYKACSSPPPALPAWIHRWPTTIKHINVNVSRLLLIGNKNVLSKANCREIRSFQYFSRGL